MIKLIEISRAKQHLAFEHDGVRFDWTGPGAMAIIALVENMMKQQPPDGIETLGGVLGQELRAMNPGGFL